MDELRRPPWYGMLTRAEFLDQLHARMLHEEGPETGWLAFVDLDRMKWTNDRFGRGVGEARLVMTAEVVDRNSRQPRLGARFSGKTFLVWLPEATEPDALMFTETLQWDVAQLGIGAGRARRMVATPELAGELVEARFTVTVGLAPTLPTDRSYKDLLRRADLARAAAKDAGGGGCCIEDGTGTISR